MSKLTIGYIQNTLCPIYHWSKSKGVYQARRSYFYRPEYNAREFAAFVEYRIQQQLIDTHTVKLIDCGDKWFAFKGGASAARQSHYWVKLTIEPIENQPE